MWHNLVLDFIFKPHIPQHARWVSSNSESVHMVSLTLGLLSCSACVCVCVLCVADNDVFMTFAGVFISFYFVSFHFAALALAFP